MAQPLPFDSPKRDCRNELRRKLEAAPDEHAEAILAGYEVLQGLHDTGVLELARGVMGGGEKVLAMSIDALSSPEATHGIRNFLILFKLAVSINSEELNVVLGAGRLPAPSLWAIGKQAGTSNVRRGMAAGLGLLSILGKALEARPSE